MLLTLAGCNKKDSLYEEYIPQSTGQGVENSSDTSSDILPDIPRHKISEIRGEIEKQIETAKRAEYANLSITDDFVSKIPDTDVLCDKVYEMDKGHI